MKTNRLSWMLVALALVALMFGQAMSATPPSGITGNVQLPTHLGVKADTLVQISALLGTPGGGPPPVMGWTVFRGDGTTTDYNFEDSNPLVVPAGQVLVVTDVLETGYVSGAAKFSLSISKTNNGQTTTKTVICCRVNR
jgi:hypothetical protein